MRGLLLFALGCVVGACGTLVYLHKEIQSKCAQNASTCVSEDSGKDSEANEKKDGSEGHSEGSGEASDDDSDLPFIVASSDISGSRSKIPDGKIDTHRVAYNEIVNDEVSSEIEEVRRLEEFYKECAERPTFEPLYEISEYNDKDFGQEAYFFYKGDQILCADDGTVIERPALMIGTDWEKWIGMVRPNTVFMRDNRRLMNIEITIENGLYSDEYGDFVRGD